jgi:hypothetical protein
MLKWRHDGGAVKWSKCSRYCIQHATSEWWVAYSMELEPSKVGEYRTLEEAQAACRVDDAS